jgi:uracil-DNA glycosylase family 4
VLVRVRAGARDSHFANCHIMPSLAESILTRRGKPVDNVIIPGSQLLIVGEAPGADEELANEPFVGKSGWELTLMLREAGYDRKQTKTSISNICKYRPPNNDISLWFANPKTYEGPNEKVQRGIEELKAEILSLRPRVILALGNLALKTLTGKSGPLKWRGSYLYTTPEFGSILVIPCLHPAAILRMYQWRWFSVCDMRKAVHAISNPPVKPQWNLIVRPSISQALETLRWLRNELDHGCHRIVSCDIETRGGMISCLGLAWSKHDAICIPFMEHEKEDKNYWTEEEELQIVVELRLVLEHPQVQVSGQNFSYDVQYTIAQLGIKPRLLLDTMLMQHALMPGEKKALDFISSLHCEYYVYWKDDGKLWDPSIPEEQHWRYNAEDCIRTFECQESLSALLRAQGLWHVYEFLLDEYEIYLEPMLRGVLVDRKRKGEISLELMSFIAQLQEDIYHIIGHQININSPTQLKVLFYQDLGLREIRNRKTGNVTTDDDALQLFAKREPLLKGLVDRIAVVRSAGVLLSTFANGKLDPDGRGRTEYVLTGAETFRLSSRTNVFGYGGNYQNIPSGDDEDARLKKLSIISKGGRALIVPNMKEMYIPDPGYEFLDMDQERADLMVVIAEADDLELFEIVRSGADLHRINAGVLFAVAESAVTKKQRQAAKQFVHGTDYGGSARTMAIVCGLTVHEADVAQRRWFGAHPGIKKWHERTEDLLQRERIARNAFGFRIWYSDRVDGLLPEALAWVPQSTVAIVTSKAAKAIRQRVPEARLSFQVHDSLTWQYPKHLRNPILRKIREAARIVVPYPRPLEIEWTAAVSDRSWGECESIDWPEPLAA